MSWRGAKDCPASPVAIKGAMRSAGIGSKDVARILGLPIQRILLILMGKASFTFDQLARLKDFLAWTYREKGLMPKLREEGERAENDPRGLAEQFHRPQVRLLSVPTEKSGGSWFRDPNNAPAGGGIVNTVLHGAPEYLYIVPPHEWDLARQKLEGLGYLVVNRDAPEGWFDVPQEALDISSFPADFAGPSNGSTLV